MSTSIKNRSYSKLGAGLEVQPLASLLNIEQGTRNKECRSLTNSSESRNSRIFVKLRHSLFLVRYSIFKKREARGWTSKLTHLTLFFLLLLLTACDNKPEESPGERQDRIAIAVEERLEKRRVEKMQKCRKDALAISEKKVDSMLLAEAKLITIDTVDKPAIPLKPATPEILLPKDSTPIEPLFDKIPDSLGIEE